MILLLYGADSFRRLIKKRAILSEFNKKHPASYGANVFDLSEDVGRQAFVAFATTGSMFDPARLAVLQNAYDAAPALKPVLKAAAEDSKLTVLISEDEKPPKPLDFLNKKSDKIFVQEFKPLKGAEFKSALAALAKERGITIAVSAATVLERASGGNLWFAVTELEKAACFGKTKIEPQDIGGNEGPAPDFWTMVNGMKSADVKTRIATLERIFLAGEAAAKIFNIIAYQLPGKLKNMAEYDLLIKSGKLDYEEALLDLVLR